MRELIKNKAWKTWKTRKLTFCYMLCIGTIAIIVSGVFSKCSSEWLVTTLNFCKFVVGTGTVIILIPNISSLVKFVKGESDEC